MIRQHLLPCSRCAAMRCPCPPEPSVLEVELLHALGNRPEKLPKPHRSGRRRALDANQPALRPEIDGDGPKPVERPDTGLTALEALENVSARKWSYRPKDAA